ncbi:MAG: TIGR00296 family protein [Methanomicrobia archaeon]|nr:TIGR00296 family protein [Methanomicrobia archaeon]
MFTLEEGEELVRIARENIETYLSSGRRINLKDVKEKYRKKMGVFVTLNKDGELRGCIGYPRPVLPLIDALLDVSISAAVRDPRFPPVTLKEMEKITVEITILTPPELIKCKPKDYPKNIKIGRDGLIVEKGFFSGLLLPQVAVEWNWNEEEFLSNTCLKAGLPMDAWLDPDTRVYRFQGQIFYEDSGKVKEKSFKA